MKSGVRQVWSFLPFLLNVVIEIIMKITPIDTRSDRKLSDLEYVEDVVLLTEDPSKLPVFCDCPNDSVGMCGIRFALFKCTIQL